jgi:hypothetical protein
LAVLTEPGHDLTPDRLLGGVGDAQVEVDQLVDEGPQLAPDGAVQSHRLGHPVVIGLAEAVRRIDPGQHRVTGQQANQEERQDGENEQVDGQDQGPGNPPAVAEEEVLQPLLVLDRDDQRGRVL